MILKCLSRAVVRGLPRGQILTNPNFAFYVNNMAYFDWDQIKNLYFFYVEDTVSFDNGEVKYKLIKQVHLWISPLIARKPS